MFIILLGIFLMVGCKDEEKNLKATYEHTFRMAESHPKSHPTAQADLEFVRRVEEETEGRVKIKVYFDNELGEEKDVTKEVSFGAIDFARVSIAPMADIVPELYVLQLPYLYEDKDHMWRVLNSDIGDQILKGIKDYGYIGFTWFDAGARSFYTRDQPIREINDLSGMSIRIMENSLMLDMSKAMGFEGIQKAYGEVYALLQQGDVEGAENNFSSYLTANHYQVAGYYTMDEHLRVPEMIIGSQKALANISPQDMEIIHRVAKETTEYQKQLWEEMEENAKNKLIDAGVKLYELDDRAPFIEAVQPMYDKYALQYGDLIKQIKAKGEGD